MGNWRDEDKIAAAVASGILALLAIEKWFKHRTFGNGLKGFAAMLSFAAS